MSTQADDAVRLRLEDACLADWLSQVERDPSLGMPCLVAQTRTLSRYPTSPQQFFACSPLSVLGTEVEGGTGTLSVGNSTFFALNLGSAIPPSGTSVIVTFVDNRWVFRFDA